jgi:hypothetical protein
LAAPAEAKRTRSGRKRRRIPAGATSGVGIGWRNGARRQGGERRGRRDRERRGVASSARGGVRFSYADGAAGQWAAWLTPVDKYYLWAPSMCWVVRCSVVF